MGPNRLAEFREYLRCISLPLFLYVLLNSVYPISQCQLFVSVGLTDPLPVYPRDIWLLNKLFVENESSSRLTYKFIVEIVFAACCPIAITVFINGR